MLKLYYSVSRFYLILSEDLENQSLLRLLRRQRNVNFDALHTLERKNKIRAATEK